MDSAGACLTVAEFTDSINFPKCRRRKDRSRMVLNARDLCGIIATGDIFSFSGRLLMISPYLMTFAYPFFTFSFVSSCSALSASNSVAEECGPFLIAASMCSLVQFGPQSVGHPSFA